MFFLTFVASLFAFRDKRPNDEDSEIIFDSICISMVWPATLILAIFAGFMFLLVWASKPILKGRK